MYLNLSEIDPSLLDIRTFIPVHELPSGVLHATEDGDAFGVGILIEWVSRIVPGNKNAFFGMWVYHSFVQGMNFIACQKYTVDLHSASWFWFDDIEHQDARVDFPLPVRPAMAVTLI